MQAIAITRFGAPDGLAVVDLPEPDPGPAEVLLAVEAVGVGGVDALIRSGALSAYGFTEGFIPGGEIAGRVIAVGAEVDAGWIGRRVWAFTGLGGGYVERAAVPVEGLIPLPDGLSPAAAVTVASSGVVARFGLAHARFSPGESVLVRGAAGGIGVLAVQFAARGGAGAVAVTTSSAPRGARLRELGATHVLDRSGAGGPDAPESYDVILDVVLGPDLPVFLDRLSPGGRLVAVGMMGGPPLDDVAATLLADFRRSRSFATFSSDIVPDTDRRTAIADLLAATARGEFAPVVEDILALADAAEAHARMDAGGVFGRLVLVPATA